MTKNKFDEIKEKVKTFLEDTGDKLEQSVEEANNSPKNADHDIRNANK